MAEKKIDAAKEAVAVAKVNAEKKTAKNEGPKIEKAPEKPAKKGIGGPIGAVILFVKQIFSELKNVTAPTKDELIEYSIVVLVFVLVIMLFITGVDFLIGKGVMALFAK